MPTESALCIRMLISAGAVTANSRKSMATLGARGDQDSGTLPNQGLLRHGLVCNCEKEGERASERNLTQSQAAQLFC